LSGYGTAEYDRSLHRAFANAEGLLVINPQIVPDLSPYAKAVHVVPSGFDSARFPWPWPLDRKPPFGAGKKLLCFAGLTQEFMKGFHVLQAACRKLWQKRKDFELLATADAKGAFEPYVRYVGWHSREVLPALLRSADILVFPTIAEEAMGRTAVEAMGVGRPVIASRIGGLPYTVLDGVTGLLFEPGNVDDLAAKIEILLDDPDLRSRLGAAGRRRFEENYTWEVVIDKYYRALLHGPCDAVTKRYSWRR
jgi:glycosyltransferase involved in cell wall biosynthesis